MINFIIKKKGWLWTIHLGPIFADIFLGYYENEWLINCPNDFKPLFDRRYIDDTFAVFREITHFTGFFNYINNKYKSHIRSGK